jgi:hypothetical protein
MSGDLRSSTFACDGSTSISVASVDVDFVDSTGEGSTVAGYGEGGGARDSERGLLLAM